MNNIPINKDIDPDREIEYFWYGFKNSMINFYKYYKLNRPIEHWSNELNQLKKKKNMD